jgi:hypothetical protein
MRKLDIYIDRLTHSIENVITGDVFDTEILPVDSADRKTLRTGWRFDWISEITRHDVYKLVIVGNPNIIQGLISIKAQNDHLFINLVESASFNIGRNKIYEGVGGNLFAFACRRSFEYGLEGFVVFHAKSNLIRHYSQHLGAARIGHSLVMVIDTEAAQKLVDIYYRK